MGLSDYRPDPQFATKKKFAEEHPPQEFSPDFTIGSIVTTKNPGDLIGWWKVTGIFGDFAQLKPAGCRCRIPLEPCELDRIQARRRGALRRRYR